MGRAWLDRNPVRETDLTLNRECASLFFKRHPVHVHVHMCIHATTLQSLGLCVSLCWCVVVVFSTLMWVCAVKVGV